VKPLAALTNLAVLDLSSNSQIQDLSPLAALTNLTMLSLGTIVTAQQGRVTSAHALLEYLHHSGVVFYQHGLSHDQIILDQRWAIDARFQSLRPS
jgi:hypothetical protein